jgi:hypothetical protein
MDGVLFRTLNLFLYYQNTVDTKERRNVVDCLILPRVGVTVDGVWIGEWIY